MLLTLWPRTLGRPSGGPVGVELVVSARAFLVLDPDRGVILELRNAFTGVVV